MVSDRAPRGNSSKADLANGPVIDVSNLLTCLYVNSTPWTRSHHEVRWDRYRRAHPDRKSAV